MRRRILFISIAALFTLALCASVWGADMISGTWKLNVAKSKYSPGPAPKAQTVVWTASPDGSYKVFVDGTNAEGKKTHNEYTFKMDSKDYPMKPMIDGKADATAADGVSAKKVDDFTFEITRKLKGQALTTEKQVISKDGKTRTITSSGKNSEGKAVANTIVYDKQ